MSEAANSEPEHFRVKIVAIAKDEAAYIPEWVHHHLYFGFDAIEIHINRTSDNSAEVLNEICQHYPSVSWEYADWVDMCPGEAATQIQFVIYAKALFETRKTNEFSHILFLDIDEFWCPDDFSTTIQEHLVSMPPLAAVFYEWVNDLGSSSSFSSLQQSLEGNLSPLGKTILPVSLDIVELRHHAPLLANKSHHVIADGTKFKARKKPVQALDASLNSLKKVFIYHRAHRSSLEYVSLLYRGRPGNDFKYKNNRTGMPRRNLTTCTINFPTTTFETFQSSYDEFKNKLDFQDLVDTARTFVNERFKRSLGNMDNAISTNYKDMLKIFSNVKTPEVADSFAAYRRKKINGEPDNATLICDLAIDAAKHNIDEAIELIKRAHQMLPRDKRINQKLEQFKEERLNLTRGSVKGSLTSNRASVNSDMGKMKYYCIASPHKDERWYDHRLYLNLQKELSALGYLHQAGAKNRIYFLGGPQRLFYPKVGQFDPAANNIALVYCHAEKLKSLNQFNKVFVCSDGFKRYFQMRKWRDLEFLRKDKYFTTKQAIEVIRPFSSLTPASQTMPRYQCDVSFMGVPRIRPALEEVLPLVDELGVKLNIYGPGWHSYPGKGNPEKYWIAKTIPYEDISQLARGSKICLVDHHESMNRIGSVSHKYIDFVMAGGFVVSDYNRDAEKYYKGICFSERRPLKEIIKEYLNDDEKRKAHVLMQQKIIIDQTTRAAAVQLAECFV